MKYCDRKGCGKPAKLKPVLLLYAVKDGVPAEAEFQGLVVCESCTSKLTLKDFLRSDQWKRIVMNMMMANRAPPVKELTELVWRPL